MTYRAILTPDDNGTLLVTFPDIPEAITFGDTVEDALVRARDALATAVDIYVKTRRRLPHASVGEGYPVSLPALVDVKVGLVELMRERHITPAQLSRLLKWHRPQVDRLTDIKHASRLDQLEQAFAAIGKRLSWQIIDDTPPPKAAVRKAHRPAARHRQAPRPSTSKTTDKTSSKGQMPETKASTR